MAPRVRRRAKQLGAARTNPPRASSTPPAPSHPDQHLCSVSCRIWTHSSPPPWTMAWTSSSTRISPCPQWRSTCGTTSDPPTNNLDATVSPTSSSTSCSPAPPVASPQVNIWQRSRRSAGRPMPRRASIGRTTSSWCHPERWSWVCGWRPSAWRTWPSPRRASPPSVTSSRRRSGSATTTAPTATCSTPCWQASMTPTSPTATPPSDRSMIWTPPAWTTSSPSTTGGTARPMPPW